jgi:sec-independent protein translocase protein TatB
MFGDIGWAELMVIGVVALIVIGPQDLPHMFQQLGRFTAKLSAMGREFSRAMETAAKETGVRDVANDMKNIASPKAMGWDKVKEAADRFEKWDPLNNTKAAAKPLVPAPMPATPVPVVSGVVAPVVTADVVNAPVITDTVINIGHPQIAAMPENAAMPVSTDAARNQAPLHHGPVKRATRTPAVAKSSIQTTDAAPIVAAKPRAPRKSKKAELE